MWHFVHVFMPVLSGWKYKQATRLNGTTQHLHFKDLVGRGFRFGALLQTRSSRNCCIFQCRQDHIFTLA